MTITYTPAYYSQFHCSNSQCPDTCCKGFDIELDSKSVQVYNGFTGVLKELVKPNLVCKNGSFYIRNHNYQCVFLTDDKLCKLQLLGGESALCYTCRVYPRFEITYEGCKSAGLSLSCPTACKLILNADSDSYPFFSADTEKSISEFVTLLNNELFPVNDIKQIITSLNTREFCAKKLSQLQSDTHYVKNSLSSKVTLNLCRYLCFRYSDTFDIEWKNISYWFVALASVMIDNSIIADEEEIYKLAKDIEHSSCNVQNLNCQFIKPKRTGELL